MGSSCEKSINTGVERALGLGKIVQGNDYCGEHRATRPGLVSAILYGGEKQALLHIHSSARSGEKRVRSVQALCWVPLTSRIRQSNGGHMQSRMLVPVFVRRSLLLVVCVALNSCQSHKANSGPLIEFTHIPPASQGGRERVDTISGRVRNGRSNQKIVVYAHAGQWWVQPWPPYLGS